MLLVVIPYISCNNNSHNSVFLMATQKLPHFFCFFKRKKNFEHKQTFSSKIFWHAKFKFFLYYNYLDAQSLNFLPFFLIISQNAYLFFMACLCMPRSKQYYLKSQTLKIIIFEKFCQNLKVYYFPYIICKKQP